MKRGVCIILFLALGMSLILTQDVSALPVCGSGGESQLILRLSGATNAHGARWDQTNPTYPTEICYNQIFGSVYAGANPHTCAGTNAVVRLSGATNAHAENPGLTTGSYTPVCYGNLVCVPRSGSCQGNEREIVSLSGATNAHIETAAANTYTKLICCSASGVAQPQCSNGADDDGDDKIDFGTAPTNDPGCDSLQDDDESDLPGAGGDNNFTGLQWHNSAGQIIGRTQNIMTHVNNTVSLIAFNRFPDNTNITIEVWDDDSGANPTPDDLIRTFTMLNYQSPTNPNIRVAAIFNYKITDADVQRAYEGLPGLNEFSDDKVEFYFKARTTNPAISAEVNLSEIVDVNLTESANTPPNAHIVAPVHRGVYYDETTVTFKHNSTDEQGPITSLWRIEEDGFTSTSASFNYTFHTSGQKTITLRVSDGQGLWDEDQVAVLVVSSPGMFSYINEPFHRQIVRTADLRVRFNANDSYVVNSEGVCPSVSVTCVAGICPSSTQNAPPGCSSTLQIQNTPQGFSSLLFNWTFDDGANVTGAGIFAGAKQYIGGQEGERNITLVLNYTNTGLNAFLQQFTKRTFTLINVSQCVDGGYTYIELDSQLNEIGRLNTSAPGGYCAGPDGLYSTIADNCCPSGNECTENGCVPTLFDECSDYNPLGRSSCNGEANTLRIAYIDPLGQLPPVCNLNNPTIVNGSLVRCSCQWSGPSETQGTCNLTRSYIPSVCTGSGCTFPNCTPNQCIVGQAQTSECINGYITVNVTYSFISGGTNACTGGETQLECQSHSGPRTILCGRPTVAFGFFNVWQFMITLIVIAIAYLFILQRFPLIKLLCVQESLSIHSRTDAAQSTGMSISRKR